MTAHAFVVRGVFLALVSCALSACGDSSKDPGHEPDAVRNLVLIVLEGVRSDALNDSDASMPLLYERAKSGVRIDRAYARTPSSNSSMATILTGLPPREHGVRDGPYVPRMVAGVTSYAEDLRDRYGYETVAFASDRWRTGRSDSVLQGFATAGASFALANTEATLDSWMATRSEGKPFFLLIQADEACAPYDLTDSVSPIAESMPAGDERDRLLAHTYLANGAGRDQLAQRFGADFRDGVARYLAASPGEPADEQLSDQLLASYRRRLGSIDEQLERAIRALDERGLLKNTLLVVTSSHGQAFREHGTLGNGHHVHAELTGVPLVIQGLSDSREVLRVAATADVLPTFYEAAGLAAPAHRLGRSVKMARGRPAYDRVVFSEVEVDERIGGTEGRSVWAACRSGQWSFVIAYEVGAGLVREHLYFQVGDRGEQVDVARGGLDDAAFSEAFCAAVEKARDAVWGEVAAAQALVGTVHGTGIGVLRSKRPATCRPLG